MTESTSENAIDEITMLARLRRDADLARQKADQLNIHLMSENAQFKNEMIKLRSERDFYMRFAMGITAELHAISKVINGSITYAEEHALWEKPIEKKEEPKAVEPTRKQEEPKQADPSPPAATQAIGIPAPTSLNISRLPVNQMPAPTADWKPPGPRIVK